MIYKADDITEELFNIAKECAKEVWVEGYSDEHGYVSEKLEAMDSWNYHPDNIIPVVQQFDPYNQIRLFNKIVDRGGNPKSFLELFYFFSN